MKSFLKQLLLLQLQTDGQGCKVQCLMITWRSASAGMQNTPDGKQPLLKHGIAHA
jgi:hypothetical protein